MSITISRCATTRVNYRLYTERDVLRLRKIIALNALVNSLIEKPECNCYRGDG